MRILSVASYLPYPADHPVKRRTWHLLEHLATHEEVTLLTWAAPSTPPQHLAAVRDRVANLIVLPWRPAQPARPARLAREALAHVRGIPAFAQFMLTERRPLPPIRGPFDIVVAEDEVSLLLLPPVAAPAVVHRLNILTRTMAELARSITYRGIRRAKTHLEAPLWRRYERRLTAAADLSIAVSDELAGALRALSPGAPVAVVPQGVRIPSRQVRPGSIPRAVFLGTMNYDPNVDAAVWFRRRVWPEVRRQVPDAELWIIGRGPEPAVRALAGDGVRILGEVPDLSDACEGAWVGVAPLRAGWGVKTKSLEMMAMGLPLVATRRGAEGLGGAEGLWVADDPAAFAAAVTRLLADRAAAVSAGAAARRSMATLLPFEEPPHRYRALLRSLAAGGAIAAARAFGSATREEVSHR